MSKKNDLGKGIRALISNIESKNDGRIPPPSQQGTATGVHEIELALIELNPYQPRVDFNEAELGELADSILKHGIIQPITLRKIGGNNYQLISGERRLRAAKLAKLKKIPAFIRKANDQEMVEMALLENIQRSDLNSLEIAISYQRLIDEFKLTHDQLSERLSKKRSTISNYLRLLKLPPAIQEKIKSGEISMGHARVIAGLEDKLDQLDLCQRVIAQGMSVRATEALAKSWQAPKATRPPAEPENKDPYISDITTRLRDHLGSKVQIQHSHSGKGKIAISYASVDHLNDILEAILQS